MWRKYTGSKLRNGLHEFSQENLSKSPNLQRRTIWQNRISEPSCPDFRDDLKNQQHSLPPLKRTRSARSLSILPKAMHSIPRYYGFIFSNQYGVINDFNKLMRKSDRLLAHEKARALPLKFLDRSLQKCNKAVRKVLFQRLRDFLCFGDLSLIGAERGKGVIVS
jgi:hypothetical protein